MATSKEFAEYVCDQLMVAGNVSYRKMFGEYGVYLDEKIVGLICDNQFFLKKTEVGRSMIEEHLTTVEEGLPYPGAKPQFLIESLDDREWLGELLRASYQELPMPKPKKKKK
ncbi:MAG: competence protein TfoX [Acetobacterium sp. MES1]|uniref:TfoX/Sxy family protein n=1 Tax=Acetobacterium sp. MES1 TaxID=1899015 RepID=UPI000B9CCA1C|nr:TfoX/Sxy family protein [Acetobacterium sp. MES1]OXS26935.1 MAG: competence protein TfoX [Acetobacterium sp. MES1]